ncbi:MAG TPA: hypothetical protein VLJ39_01990, partial [Tepidisphaeraceae bacterium]|nr:hypothetical protein [Tepidisphaeraceae bacterium]
MYNVIKKYQTKLMAIFAVLLMVSFVATIGVGRGGMGTTSANVVVGHSGKTPVYLGEMNQAKEEWSFLNRVSTRMPLPAMVFLQEIVRENPAASRDIQLQMAAFQLGRTISDNINQHPEMFLLLQKEAAANGLTVSKDQANEFLKNQLGIDVSNDDQGAFQTQAVQHLLMVASQLHHLMTALKVSEPAWQHDAAMEQAVRLSMVDFRVSDFIKSVPAPTTQQVEQQFDKYKDVPPGETSPANPLGFGYQVPTRVKLQYLEIPRAQVVESVVHNIPPAGSEGSANIPYAWDVQAALYYEKHSEEFKNTPPATEPATTQASNATQPSTQPVASTEPAIKPFAQVKQEIIDKLVADDVEKQTKLISDDLIARLKSDFDLISKADPQA